MVQWSDTRQGIREVCGHLNMSKACSPYSYSVRFKDPRPRDPHNQEWAGLLEANLTHIQQRLRVPLTSVNDFLDAQIKGVKLYLHDAGIDYFCPALFEYFKVPKYFPIDFQLQHPEDSRGDCDPDTKELPRRMSMMGRDHPSIFIGPQNSESKTHVDARRTRFWMAMINGTKHWHMFHPRDTRYLYATDESFPDESDAHGDIEGSFPGIFDVDTFRPDFSLWPELRKATLWNASITKGDILFIPEDWPHQVYNPGASVALAYNYVDRHNLDKYRRYQEHEARHRRTEMDDRVARNGRIKQTNMTLKEIKMYEEEHGYYFDNVDGEDYISLGHWSDDIMFDLLMASSLWPSHVSVPKTHQEEHFRDWFRRNAWKLPPYTKAKLEKLSVGPGALVSPSNFV